MLIKEPKNVDFSNKSKPWTEKELPDFRKILQEIKSKRKQKDFRKYAEKLTSNISEKHPDFVTNGRN